jgi:hypothetical protein
MNPCKQGWWDPNVIQGHTAGFLSGFIWATSGHGGGRAAVYTLTHILELVSGLGSEWLLIPHRQICLGFDSVGKMERLSHPDAII